MNWSELKELSETLDRRVLDLTAQGVNIIGMGEHYIQTMLEELLGGAALDRAREKHLLWLKDRLDTIDDQIRRAKLLQGVAGHNGQPHA
ncbi:MAG TPA: hypothetical protein VKU91_00250 [Acidimicrobiales bacterium]|nr:hypothetical protein [Acidimicrobiales bacterium]